MIFRLDNAVMYCGGDEGKDNKCKIKTALGGTRGFLTDFVGVLKD